MHFGSGKMEMLDYLEALINILFQIKYQKTVKTSSYERLI